MCRSMADIQSATAEIRRGKKEERKKERNQRANIYIYIYIYILHRAAIIIHNNYNLESLITCKGSQKQLHKLSVPVAGSSKFLLVILSGHCQSSVLSNLWNTATRIWLCNQTYFSAHIKISDDND